MALLQWRHQYPWPRTKMLWNWYISRHQHLAQPARAHCVHGQGLESHGETVVNEILSRNVIREMTGNPPISLAESLEVANIVCARKGGQLGDLHRKIDPYSA